MISCINSDSGTLDLSVSQFPRLVRSEMSDTECIEANIEAVNVKRYLDEGYSKSVLFKRAMMVFRSSYYGYVLLLLLISIFEWGVFAL